MKLKRHYSFPHSYMKQLIIFENHYKAKRARVYTMRFYCQAEEDKSFD